MKRNEQMNITDQNLSKLSEFLTHELEKPHLTKQIPDGAHLFHGSHLDQTLTRTNLELVSNILLAMILGYVEEAPLMMIYEYATDQYTIINLSDELQKNRAKMFIEGFQKQSQNEMIGKINELCG